MEQECVIFAEIPHHVISRFVDPVPEIQHHRLDPLRLFRRQKIPVAGHQKGQWREAEVRAVVVALDFFAGQIKALLRIVIPAI